MKIALFLLITIYLFVPITLYKINNKKIARFCLLMTISMRFRAFFCYMLLLAVTYFHYIFYQSFRSEFGIMISSLLLIAMFSTRFTEGILTTFADDNRKLFAFTIAVLILAFIPHMLPLASTMAIILVGVCFYPSPEIRKYDDKNLIRLYNECSRKQDFRDFQNKYFS